MTRKRDEKTPPPGTNGKTDRAAGGNISLETAMEALGEMILAARESGKVLRHLRRAYPGTQFTAEPQGAGTGAPFILVSWADGPGPNAVEREAGDIRGVSCPVHTSRRVSGGGAVLPFACRWPARSA